MVLDRPELACDPRFESNVKRVKHRAVLDAEIAAVFGGLTAAQIVDRLDRASIANARMNSVEEFLQHPQLAARNRWRTIESPVGPLSALVPPATLAETEPVMGPIPDVGQHTDAILEELGFDRATVARWRAAAMI